MFKLIKRIRNRRRENWAEALPPAVWVRLL